MIGVYDSGAGGLSVWRELVRLMPEEDYLYVGDNAFCPYGEKPQEVIQERAEAVSRFLIGKGADVIVIACNTATAAAIDLLRTRYPQMPFVGMEPAIKPAALSSKSGVVGVLATANTLRAEKYHNTLERFASGVKVIERVGEGLVEAVENGTDATPLLKKYLSPMLEAGADAIVLGCTHYPFLEERIKALTGPSVRIVNPAPAVARHTRTVLSALTRNDLPSGRSVFYSTGTADALRRLSSLEIPSLEDGSWHPYLQL